MLSCHAIGALQLAQADRGLTNDIPRVVRSRTKLLNEASEAQSAPPIIINSRTKTLPVMATKKNLGRTNSEADAHRYRRRALQHVQLLSSLWHVSIGKRHEPTHLDWLTAGHEYRLIGL
jgi:hypothetical protein